MNPLLARLLGVFSTDMGIDLGTANTLVCVSGHGIVLNEPSVVAVYKGTNQIVGGGKAVGLRAKEMLGKTPGNIDAIRPMKNGVIADFEITEAMLRYFIRKVHGERAWVHPQIVVAIPSGITAVEKRAVINSAERAGARRVELIEEPLAAAMGVGLPIREPTACMICDIGGGTTEVAVISLGNIVTARSIRIAGDEFDEAIINHLRHYHNLAIGEQTAERIKLTIGSAFPLKKEVTMPVRGRNITEHLPREVTITSDEIRQALTEPVMMIVKAVKECLEHTPPELSADLVDNGIVLAGGGSMLRGIDRVITQQTGLPVRIVKEPLLAVARGTAKYLENIEMLKRLREGAGE
ncbi:MAG: rod shape-determining protein MreB [Planctomycetota bacterium]|jgi:rod shape-determining protein MreB